MEQSKINERIERIEQRIEKEYVFDEAGEVVIDMENDLVWTIKVIAQLKDDLRIEKQNHLDTSNWAKEQQDRADRFEADAARLDFLQAQTKGYGRGWILRESLHGRGMRLHETSMRGAKPTVREAIDAAMEVDQRGTKEA